MNTDHKEFFFDSYEFDTAKKTLTLTYAIDSDITFTETYKFDFPFVQYDPMVLDRAVQNLFFMVGVSYYKTFIPPQIVIRAGKLDPQSAAFYSRAYQKGLGEFWYVNQLDPNTPVNIPYNVDALRPLTPQVQDGLLIGIGGGKDSLVSVELLRDQPRIATWSVNHRSQLTPLVERIGLQHFWVERTWDQSLLEHNAKGGLNGHIPISAIFAHVGTVVGILAGYKDSIVSNENSANEPTLEYQGVAINHQYSKSLQFEQDYQVMLMRQFGSGLRYYSFLRPFSEVRISELFAKIGFEKYKDVFSSCNRAYTHDQDHLFWCGECAKCAFTFMALTPFIPKDQLETLFHGKNLLHDEDLEPIYKKLLGIEPGKPLDCVGEVKESRVAMQLAEQADLSLLKYHYELPSNYDFRTMAPSSMPEDMLRILISRA